METVEVSNEALEWEDNNETICISNSTLRRYSQLAEIVIVLTADGCPMNYELVTAILVTLPSVCSPLDLFKQLSNRYLIDAEKFPLAIKEQIQMKVLVIIRCWARSPSAHCDMSGPLIESMIDFTRLSTDNESPAIVAAGRKVRSILKTIRDDLQNIDAAQSCYRERVAKMAVVFDETTLVEEPVQISTQMRLATSPEQIGRFDNRHYISPQYNSPRNDSSRLSFSKFTDKSKSSVGSFASVSLGGESREDPSATVRLLQDSIERDTCRQVFFDRSGDVVTNTNTAGNTALPGPGAESSSGMSSMSLPAAAAMSPELINGHDSIWKTFPDSAAGARKWLKMAAPRKSIIKMYSYKELAAYLTIIEYEDCLLSVRPRELIGLAWTKKELKCIHPDLGGAANLCRVIHCTNQRIAWIAREIIDYASYFGSTAEAIEYFLRTARVALKLNNFSTLFQIVSALGLPAVKGLKSGWSNVASAKQALFKSFMELCSPEGNFVKYRHALQAAARNPRVPCLQVIMRDITMLEASGPWRSGGKIDVKKAMAMFELISSYLRSVSGGDITAYNISITQQPVQQESLTKYQTEIESDFSRSSTLETTNSHDNNNNVNGLGVLSPSNSQNGSIQSSASLAGHMSPLLSSGLSNAMKSPAGINMSSNHSQIIHRNQKPELFLHSTSSPRTAFFSHTAEDDAGSSKQSIDQLRDAWKDEEVIEAPSFKYNCLVVRDSFFDPLHEEYQFRYKLSPESDTKIISPSYGCNFLSPQLSTLSSTNASSFSSSTSSFSSSTSSSATTPTTSGAKSTRRNRLSGLFTRAFKSPPPASQLIELTGDDIKLAQLQHRILSVCVDMNKLWNDSKVANEVESNRLVGKLAQAGLF